MPQPIDMQTELARTNMAERMQEIAGRASLVAQQRVSDETERLRRQLETNIQETPQSQSEHIDREGKRQNPFVGRRKKRAARDGDETAQTFYGADERPRVVDDPGGHGFDVRV